MFRFIKINTEKDEEKLALLIRFLGGNKLREQTIVFNCDIDNVKIGVPTSNKPRFYSSYLFASQIHGV